MQGRASEAVELLERARVRAEALGRSDVREEAESLGALALGRRTRDPDRIAHVHTAQDVRVIDVLRGELDEQAADALLRALSDEGRDDRAARVALALAARGSAEHRARYRGAYETAMERVRVGMTPEETARVVHHLLSFPDPRPEDWAAGEIDEEIDMEVLSILEINHRLVEQEDLPTLLGAIVEHAIEVTGAERGFLVLEESGVLTLDLALDSSRGDIARPEIEVSNSIIRTALEQGDVLRLSNAASDPDLGEAPSVASLELRSILCCPFVVDNDVRGAIYLDDRTRRAAFSDRAERVLKLFADQAALAIRQVRRLEDIRRLNQELGREVVERNSELASARQRLEEAGATRPIGGLIGESEAMRGVHSLIGRVAPSDLSVLICGPSGTGKELAARAVHELSGRSERPYVAENCAAIPESLIEAELFGYCKGAFTGAHTDRVGLFERVEGGTLFLDEIGELPLDMQAKLLRVLENREIRRLGEEIVRPVDFRLVTATNRDLMREVVEGRFREDLVYRIDGLRIDMPALDDRIEDIPLLVDHFLSVAGKQSGVTRRISEPVLRALSERSWPGNVRELANEIARLCVLHEGDLDQPESVRPARATGTRPVGQEIRSMAALEREAILGALQRTGGDKRRAADLLGISRAKIYQRLKEWRDSSDS